MLVPGPSLFGYTRSWHSAGAVFFILHMDFGELLSPGFLQHQSSYNVHSWFAHAPAERVRQRIAARNQSLLRQRASRSKLAHSASHHIPGLSTDVRCSVQDKLGSQHGATSNGYGTVEASTTTNSTVPYSEHCYVVTVA